MQSILENQTGCAGEKLNVSINWMYEAFAGVCADPLLIDGAWWDADEDLLEQHRAIIDSRVNTSGRDLVTLWMLHEGMRHMVREIDGCGLERNYEKVFENVENIIKWARLYENALVKHDNNRAVRDDKTRLFVKPFLRFPHYSRPFHDGFNEESNKSGFEKSLRDLSTSIHAAQQETHCDYVWQRVAPQEDIESVYALHQRIVRLELQRFGLHFHDS